MAPRGSLVPAALLWLCPVLAALVRLHQPQPVLVVEPGEPVEMVCTASEDMESKTRASWYRRSADGPQLVVDCSSGTNGEFSCEFSKRNVTLRIAQTRTDHTGLYLCAYRNSYHPDFGSGTALLVGDSWQAQSWVRVLAPAGDPCAPPSLVCAVGATTGPVLVSWPGGTERVLGLRGSVGLLISPIGTAGGGGGLCEVRFNASGPPIRRSVELRGATGSCMTLSSWALVGVGALLLLSLCLSIRRLCRPTPTGHQEGTPMPPASQGDEGQLTYAQLIFATPAESRR